MQCEHIQNELPAFLLGDLPPGEASAIQRHLSTCSACAEEASAMGAMHDRLPAGLKDWVAQGVCPADVMNRIEQSIRGERRRNRWTSWPFIAGYAAAAAAVFLMLFGTRLMSPEQLASIPLVGGFAAQLFGKEVDLNPVGGPPAMDIHDGVTLAVVKADSKPDSLTVQYVLRGDGLDTQATETAFRATLHTNQGELALRSIGVHRRTADEVLVEAVYAPLTAAGEQSLTLTVPTVPTRAGAPAKNGPWKATFPRP